MLARVYRTPVSCLALFVVLAGAISVPAQAMEGAAFEQLVARVKKEGFADSKINLLQTAGSTNTFTCAQVAKLVGEFSFGDDKLNAISALKGRIEDPENKGKILAVFNFDDEKEKAEALLADVQKTSPAARSAAASAAPAPAPNAATSPARGATPSAPATPAATGFAEKTPLLVNQVGAWPTADVAALVASLTKEKYSDGRMKVLKAAVASRPEGFTSAQIQQLVPLLKFSDDMVNALTVMDEHLLGMTSREVLGVLSKYSNGADKLSVLRAIKDCITDAENKFVILDAYTNSTDKDEARRILESVKPRSPVYGTIHSKLVTFVVDVSGSMEATFTTNRGEKLNRLQFVQRELQFVLKEQLPAGAKFNIVVFSSGVTSWKPGLVAATPQAIQEAVQYVGALRLSGGTNIHGALEKTLTDPETDTVYFLTDGMPSEGKKTAAPAILADVATWTAQRKVTLNTIAFLMGTHSSDNKPKSRELMYELSKVSGGVYRSIE